MGSYFPVRLPDMTAARPDELTQLLTRAEEGDPAAEPAIFTIVYGELRRLARSRMRREPSDHTLEPTALVHEAYLRLMGDQPVQWSSRGHFFAAAAHAMQRILVERARRVATIKRGGGRQRVPFDALELHAQELPFSQDLLALDAALERLARIDPRKHEVVMLRFFTGLTIEETALAIGVSLSTVKNEWSFARAWLLAEIGGEPGDGDLAPAP